MTTIEELALKIAKEQGSDAFDDWMGLGEMLDEYELGDYEREALAELVRAIHGEAWQRYADHRARLAAGTEQGWCHCVEQGYPGPHRRSEGCDEQQNREMRQSMNADGEL